MLTGKGCSISITNTEGLHFFEILRTRTFLSALVKCVLITDGLDISAKKVQRKEKVYLLYIEIA